MIFEEQINDSFCCPVELLSNLLVATMSLKFKRQTFILSLSNSSIGYTEYLHKLLLVKIHIGRSLGEFETQL